MVKKNLIILHVFLLKSDKKSLLVQCLNIRGGEYLVRDKLFNIICIVNIVLYWINKIL